ncbi:peptidoglycan-recognition protein SC2-like [Pecten maximus]|uniref:peptidoglycan-recognition protein SC2-like n=1 Tax=Pecten maximus TaxID=6579 RepID=UPI0014589F6E|nr:peptidoglycan-recognition protein SC2-like [Pecten maximus]XP_033761488.1 peptidoglycan-recognition protein SC2-like [Pecten maximus]
MIWHIIVFINIIHRTIAEDGHCACAIGNVAVYREAGRLETQFSVIPSGQCVQHRDELRFVTLSNTTWTSLEYAGQIGFVDSNMLSPEVWNGGCPDRSQSVRDVPNQCPRIITRQEWGARPPSHLISNLPATPQYVFIHHGAGSRCFTESACSDKVKSYQDFHMDTRGWWDIGYSFVVGEDGNVYEARGWDKIGAHTYGHNSVGIGISVIGDFRTVTPNQAALNAVTQLIACGVNTGKIQTNYTMQGHCDVVRTECPGKSFLDILNTWPHYHRPNGSYCPPFDESIQMK